MSAAMDETAPTTTSLDNVEARQLVELRYYEGLKDREAAIDKVFYDGHDLQKLDDNLVVLSTEAHERPREWPRSRKWIVTMITGAYCFLAPFTSTIFAPSLKSVMHDLGETDPVKGALQVAIFLLPFALAPIFQAPLSEKYGRRIVIQSGNVVFAVFSLGGGFCKTTAQLAICRFFAGFGGAASLAVYGGVLADIWDMKDRARASGALGTALLLGPVLGPSCGGWISERASWRWTCWVPAMTAACLEIVAVFYLHESYIPALLHRKIQRERKRRPGRDLYTVLDIQAEMTGKRGSLRILQSAIRPILYLFLDPALFLQSLYYAFVFGVLYIVIVTFQSVFGAGGYGHSPGIVGLDLLAEGVGAIIGMQGTTLVLEYIYKRESKKQDGYRPETRLVSAFFGAAFVSAGLFIYGFTAGRTHFIVPLLGVAIFTTGSTNTYLAMQLYIIDCFDYSASAIAGLSVLRCLFGSVFPLFGARLFESLGVDWGVGLLAFLSLGLGVPFLPVIYYYGPQLRAVGKRNRTRFFEGA